MGDVCAVGGEEAVVIVIGGGEGGVLPAGVDEWGAKTGLDLSGGIIFEGKVGDELGAAAFFDGSELAGGVVGDLVTGAVWPSRAGESAEAVVIVTGNAVRPIGDSGQQIARVIGVVDLLAVRVGEACQVVIRVSDRGNINYVI